MSVLQLALHFSHNVYVYLMWVSRKRPNYSINVFSTQESDEVKSEEHYDSINESQSDVGPVNNVSY
jgi:hypothetical protein